MAGPTRITLTGGKRMERELRRIAESAAGDLELRVGFIDGATYVNPDGGLANDLPVAQVAFWNEFGTSRAPARPFFRNMIETKQDGWAKVLEANLRATNYDFENSLNRLGFLIKQQLTASIREFDEPRNAPATIEKKGFDKPLVDTGVMQRQTGYEVGKSK